jgi:hypothetical protein
MRDYYKTLGVPHSATEAEIKQGYRSLIKQCHPDVNTSDQAADWTRQLNEAYEVLADSAKKAAHDAALRAEATQPQTKRAQATRPSPASKPAPEPAAPEYCCERCARADAGLRLAVTTRVISAFFMSRREPTITLLCRRCRLFDTLKANLLTGLLGWWNIYGFFWTIEALFKNANGGEQEDGENESLLHILALQLYRKGRYQDALEAMLEAFRLEPNEANRRGVEFLRNYALPPRRKGLWEMFRAWELHPCVYHATAGLVLGAIIYSVVVINSTSSAPATGVSTKSPAHFETPEPTRTPAPLFSEPQQPLPENGIIFMSDYLDSYQGIKAPLKVATRASDGNYVIKVEDWNTHNVVFYAYIRAGSTAEYELPLGSYRLKFATGRKWYGLDYLFGPETSYSYVPKEMMFTADTTTVGINTHGHSLELIPQVGGNLKTPKMKADNW